MNGNDSEKGRRSHEEESIKTIINKFKLLDKKASLVEIAKLLVHNAAEKREIIGVRGGPILVITSIPETEAPSTRLRTKGSKS